MMRGTFKKAEAGIAQLAVFIILSVIVGGAVATFFVVRSNKQEITQQSQTSDTSNTSLGKAQRNTARDQDAASLLSAVGEFMNNNNGGLPTAFVDGSLAGSADTTPSPVVLGLYADVVLAKGTQSPVTAITELRLVTGATCESNGATKAGSSRAIAAQYATEEDDGYTSKCKEV